jgi:hypothetical protein
MRLEAVKKEEALMPWSALINMKIIVFNPFKRQLIVAIASVAYSDLNIAVKLGNNILL